MSDAKSVSRGPVPPFPYRDGCDWAYDAANRTYRWFDKIAGGWLRDDSSTPPRPTVEQLLGPPPTTPPALPALILSPVENLDHFQLLPPDGRLTRHRDENAAQLDKTRADTPRLEQAVRDAETALVGAETRVALGEQGDCTQEHMAVAEVKAALQRNTKSERVEREVAVQLGERLAQAERQARAGLRRDIESEIARNATQQLRCFRRILALRHIERDLILRRHHLLSEAEQKILGMYEHKHFPHDAQLETFEEAFRKDGLPLPPEEP